MCVRTCTPVAAGDVGEKVGRGRSVNFPRGPQDTVCPYSCDGGIYAPTDLWALPKELPVAEAGTVVQESEPGRGGLLPKHKYIPGSPNDVHV